MWSPTISLPLREPSGRSANPLSPPGTPPQRVFTIGVHTLAAIDNARDHVEEVAPIASESVRRVTILQQLADRARVRRMNARNAAPQTTSIHQALEGLYSQLQQSEADLSRVSSELASVAANQATLAKTFRYVPTVPIGTATLVEMVETLTRLEALYHEMWARYHGVREDVRPLRQSVCDIRQSVDELGNRLDGVPFEAAGILKADLDRGQARLLAEVVGMQRAVLNTLGHLREALDRTHNVDPAVATALATAIESTTTALNSCLQNVASSISDSERASTTISQRVWDMETRLRSLEGLGAGGERPAMLKATSLVNPVPVDTSHEEALRRLGERVGVLENSFATHVQSAVAKGIKEYLEGYGLGDQALRCLGDPVTQSRMGWGIGLGSGSSGRATPEGTPIFPSVGFSFGMSKGSDI